MAEQNKMKRNIGILDWGIVFSVIVLFVAIFIPSVIWEEEESVKTESRRRMAIINDAESFYYELTSEYTTNGEELFSLVEAAMDSLTADSLFVQEHKINLNNKIYEVNMNRGFYVRVDTTFTKSQELQRTFKDTSYQISMLAADGGESTQKWVKKDELQFYMDDSLFQSVDDTEIKDVSEKFTDYARNKFHLIDDLLSCPLTGEPYILEIDDTDDSYPLFMVKSPVPEDYTERRFGIFKFESGKHGFIKDGNTSWAELD